MKITGKYQRMGNHVIVYANNCIYTINTDIGKWSLTCIGERIATGKINGAILD